MNKVLVLGLGGAGSAMAREIYRMNIAQVNAGMLHVVMMDSNRDALRSLQEGQMSATSAICISGDGKRVSDYLNKRSRTGMDSKWFRTNGVLSNVNLSNGAAQIRSLSRLLWTSLSDNSQTILREHIRFLHSTKQAKTVVRRNADAEVSEAIAGAIKTEGMGFTRQAPANDIIRVMIVSSIAGGTGSGMIMDLAGFVRAELDRNGDTEVEMYASLLLPDAFEQSEYTDAQLINIRSNAFATMRELYTTSVSGSRMKRLLNPMTLQFPGGEQGVEHPIPKHALFRTCFVFDRKRMDESEFKGNNDMFISEAASAVTLFLFGGTAMLVNSDESNFLNTWSVHNHANFCGALGAATLEFPRKDVLNTLALRMTANDLNESTLKPDSTFAEEMQQYRAARKNAINATKPDMPTRFCQIVKDEAARAYDGNPYFSAIRQCQISPDPKARFFIDSHDVRWRALAYLQGLKSFVEETLNNPGGDYCKLVDAYNTRKFEPDIKKQKSPDSYYKNCVRSATNMSETVVKLKEHIEMGVLQQLPSSLIARATNRAAGNLPLSRAKDIESLPYNIHSLFFYRDENDEITGSVSPVSARFMLYQLLMRLPNMIKENKALLDKCAPEYAQDPARILDDIATENVIETYSDILNTAKDRSAFFNKTRKENIQRAYLSIKQKYSNFVISCTQYAECFLYDALLRQMLSYVKTWLTHEERYFKKLSDVKLDLDRRVNLGREHFDNASSLSHAYLLSSAAEQDWLFDCLEQSDIVTKSDEFLPTVNRIVHNGVRDAASADYIAGITEPAHMRYTSPDAIYKDTLPGEYEKIIEGDGQFILPKTIVEAMLWRGFYEKKELPWMAKFDQTQYTDSVVQTISALENSASPFIFLADTDHMTSAYYAIGSKTYDFLRTNAPAAINSLNFARDVQELADSPTNLVLNNIIAAHKARQELRVDCLSAIYCIEPDDIFRFTAPRTEPFSERGAGDYYAPYHKRVEEYVASRGSSTSPHIDTRWGVDDTYLYPLRKVGMKYPTEALFVAGLSLGMFQLSTLRGGAQRFSFVCEGMPTRPLSYNNEDVSCNLAMLYKAIENDREVLAELCKRMDAEIDALRADPVLERSALYTAPGDCMDWSRRRWPSVVDALITAHRNTRNLHTFLGLKLSLEDMLKAYLDFMDVYVLPEALDVREAERAREKLALRLLLSCRFYAKHHALTDNEIIRALHNMLGTPTAADLRDEKLLSLAKEGAEEDDDLPVAPAPKEPAARKPAPRKKATKK